MGFSRRKRRQIRRFFHDREKVRRLVARAKGRGTLVHAMKLAHMSPATRFTISPTTVLSAKIAGKERIVKLSSFEHLSHANLLLLQRLYRHALRVGKIKPKHYVLETVKYDYSNQKVGIMEHLRGAGLRELIWFLEKAPLSEEAEARAERFLSENKWVHRANLRRAINELEADLQVVSKNGTRFSVDTTGNNIFVLGRDEFGRLRLALFDQIFPGKEKDVREMLKKKKRRR